MRISTEVSLRSKASTSNCILQATSTKSKGSWFTCQCIHSSMYRLIKLKESMHAFSHTIQYHSYHSFWCCTVAPAINLVGNPELISDFYSVAIVIRGKS